MILSPHMSLFLFLVTLNDKSQFSCRFLYLGKFLIIYIFFFFWVQVLDKKAVIFTVFGY